MDIYENMSPAHFFHSKNSGGVIQTTLSTPSNPENQKNPDHPPGSSRTPIYRIYRTVVVGLVLLCVVQLILIITFCSTCLTSPPDTMSNLDPVLEHGWSYFNYSLYLLSNETKPWHEAREQCRRKNADLVIFNSIQEQDFIQSIIRNQYIWVGLTSDWKWVDGTPEMETIWNGKSVESECVIFYRKMYKTHCSEKRDWICEKLVYHQ